MKKLSECSRRKYDLYVCMLFDVCLSSLATSDGMFIRWDKLCFTTVGGEVRHDLDALQDGSDWVGST